MINISITENWVPEQCAAGYELDFRKYPEFSHMGGVGGAVSAPRGADRLDRRPLRRPAGEIHLLAVARVEQPDYHGNERSVVDTEAFEMDDWQKRVRLLS